MYTATLWEKQTLTQLRKRGKEEKKRGGAMNAFKLKPLMMPPKLVKDAACTLPEGVLRKAPWLGYKESDMAGMTGIKREEECADETRAAHAAHYKQVNHMINYTATHAKSTIAFKHGIQMIRTTDIRPD